MDNSADVLYSDFVKVKNENNGYGLVTFFVWHEAYGYFRVTEEIEADSPEDVATYYKRELDGTPYDWCSKSEDEWELLYEAKELEYVSLY